MATAMLPQVMYVRNTSDVEFHIATGWTNMAFCLAQPESRLGWTLGANNTVFSGITNICPDCQVAYREFAEALAEANRR